MTQLAAFVSGADPPEVIREIKYIHSLIISSGQEPVLDGMYADVVKLFSGQYPGFRASNTKYHDLEHTNLVVLAVTRLMHGCFLKGHAFSPEDLILGFAAALFHDVGLIQTKSEQKGSGAVFTLGHEERSIVFMQRYLSGKNFSQQMIEDCAALIQCTILGIEIKDIPFRNRQIEILGKIVGSADLLGQMADRCYLEKLLLLYKEFEEARLPGFDSELDLLRKTEAFYKSVAQKRLVSDFSGIAACMRLHFKARWNEDRDLYAEAIENNLDYLKGLITICRDNYSCYLKNLRRGGIVQANYPQLFG
ncbi:MAG: HD domain-containing protein [Thermodesulfobacteriota bacterium]